MERFPVAILARSMALSLTLSYCVPSLAARPVTKLEPVSVGVMLPVALEQRLDAGHVRVGQWIAARLMQRVPLADGAYLPTKAKVTGTVVAYDGSTLTLRFDQLQLRHERVPIHVTPLAPPYWLDVKKTQEPLGATDRTLSNPMNWTTEQIGGDEVYRSEALVRSTTSTSSGWDTPMHTASTRRRPRREQPSWRWVFSLRQRVGCTICQEWKSLRRRPGESDRSPPDRPEVAVVDRRRFCYRLPGLHSVGYVDIEVDRKFRLL